jgi:hypothetical protein
MMKNLLNKVKNFRAATVARAKTALISAKSAAYRSRLVLAGNSGEGFVDTAGASVRA